MEMFKKVALWIVFIGISAALVVGAINRTASKSDVAAERETSGRGQASVVRQDADSEVYALGQGNNGQNRGAGRSSRSDSEPLELAQSIEADWVSIAASVVSVNDDALVLEQDDGTQLVIEGRAWRYAIETGFATDVGQEVLVAGFYEEGEFKFGAIEDLANGESVVLRDRSGKPFWSGQGRSTA
jgi:hypothetical protein